MRLADRYAAVFLPVTLAVAGLPWGLSGDSMRFLAVMVVATPCALILAAPIAFIAGVSRAARRGVIVKGGGVIERLGEARSLLLDKTGTDAVGAALGLDGVYAEQSPEDALRIGGRSLRIARQSIVVGMGLSLIAMAAAAAGLVAPVAGALLQEGIEVAVIANDLRALRG